VVLLSPQPMWPFADALYGVWATRKAFASWLGVGRCYSLGSRSGGTEKSPQHHAVKYSVGIVHNGPRRRAY
jgi:hypothetical protein